MRNLSEWVLELSITTGSSFKTGFVFHLGVRRFGEICVVRSVVSDVVFCSLRFVGWSSNYEFLLFFWCSPLFFLYYNVIIRIINVPFLDTFRVDKVHILRLKHGIELGFIQRVFTSKLYKRGIHILTLVSVIMLLHELNCWNIHSCISCIFCLPD